MSHLRNGGPELLEDLLSLGVCISGALATAHQQGVIHGDVKPQNILKSNFGATALGDFGIATFDRHELDQPLRGLSIHYVAPEVISGKAQPGSASDQYSLGATIFTLASGHRPFASSFREPANKVLRRVLWEPTPRLPDTFPEGFRDTVYRAMERKPQNRYADLTTFAIALNEIEYQHGYQITTVPIQEGTQPSITTLSPSIGKVHEARGAPIRTEDAKVHSEPDDVPDSSNTLGSSQDSQQQTRNPETVSTQQPHSTMVDSPRDTDSPIERRRMLDALVCLGCDSPNPPSFTVCRGCGVSLSKGNSGRRTVPQPALGIIYLSGGGREVVDTSLIIGRNPRHGVIEDYQRGVFLGTDDRTVSRRQVELKLEGWRPIVINIAKKAPSTIESQTGEVFILAAGDSRSLNDGDTVRFSTVWFRYHASTTVATKEVTNSGEASGPSDIVPGATLGEVCDEELPRERMVEALVCLGCDSPSPPSSEVCRGCGVNLSEVNSERRMVPQPVVGVIRLSGGGLEVLDTDLIIGRNPNLRNDRTSPATHRTRN